MSYMTPSAGILPTIDLGGHHRESGWGGTGICIIALLALVALFRGGGIFGSGDSANTTVATTALENLSDIKAKQDASLALAASGNLNEQFNDIRASQAANARVLPGETATAVQAILCPELCSLKSGIEDTVKKEQFSNAIFALSSGQSKLSGEIKDSTCVTNSNIDNKFAALDKTLCAMNSNTNEQFCNTNTLIRDKFCETNQLIKDQTQSIKDQMTAARIAALEEEVHCHRRRNEAIEINNSFNTNINNILSPITTTLNGLLNSVQALQARSV